MGLSSEMQNLSDEILASFKQRIKENEELVNDVQKTLDGFRKDHQEMTSVLNANAAALRKGLALGEKERLDNYTGLMNGIHMTISSIQQEVVAIQTSTFNMINEYTADRMNMADELNKFFAQGRTDRKQHEKNRMVEFDALMKSINDDIKSINDEVLTIFKNTNGMLANFEKEHLEMSAELRAELSKNLADRVEYTRTLLNGFQMRLAEISAENQQMARKLRNDLASGEAVRMEEYNGLMGEIHESITGIRKEVNEIKQATAEIIGDYAQNRVGASAAWSKMQEAIAQIRKTGSVASAKETAKKSEKKEVKKEVVAEVGKKAPVEEMPVETVKETPVEAVKEHVEKKEIPIVAIPEEPKTLEQKVLNFISKHPKGVKISEMEEPLGETRMKLGFTAKVLLDEGKVQKVDNIYFPLI